MNNIIFKPVIGPDGFRELFQQAGLQSGCYIIKPNWVSSEPGDYTDARVLEFLLKALPGQKIIVEAYTGWRNDGTKLITVKNAKENWEWLKDQDKKFLDSTGITTVLHETDTRYINITEECWRGNVTDHRNIEEIVTGKFAPVYHKELYRCVSRVLFRNRNAVFISLARMKAHLEKGIPVPSLAMKNMFGLIPDPVRSRYHGDRDNSLNKSIIDINKIYHSLFKVVGIVEAFPSAILYHLQGKQKSLSGKFDTVDDCNFIAFGNSLIELDAFCCRIMQINPENIALFNDAGDMLGNWKTASYPVIPADTMDKFNIVPTLMSRSTVRARIEKPPDLPGKTPKPPKLPFPGTKPVQDKTNQFGFGQGKRDKKDPDKI